MFIYCLDPINIQVWPIFKKVGMLDVFISTHNLYTSNSSLLRHDVNMGWAPAFDRFSLLSPVLSVTKFNMHKPLNNTEMQTRHPQKYGGLSNWFQRQCKAIHLESENAIHGILFSLNIQTTGCFSLVSVLCFHRHHNGIKSTPHFCNAFYRSFTLWRYCNIKPNIYKRPHLFSADDDRENWAQGWFVIYNMQCMIYVGNESRALFEAIPPTEYPYWLGVGEMT